MRMRIKPFFCVIMACVLCSSMVLSGCALSRSSLYFDDYRVTATSQGSGKILISFDVTATRTMSEVGAISTAIYEKQSNGTFTKVASYGKLTDTNSAWAYKTISYQGTVGKSYYAKVTLYARDSRGSETLTQNTHVVTA